MFFLNLLDSNKIDIFKDMFIFPTEDIRKKQHLVVKKCYSPPPLPPSPHPNLIRVKLLKKNALFPPTFWNLSLRRLSSILWFDSWFHQTLTHNWSLHCLETNNCFWKMTIFLKIYCVFIFCHVFKISQNKENLTKLGLDPTCFPNHSEKLLYFK